MSVRKMLCLQFVSAYWHAFCFKTHRRKSPSLNISVNFGGLQLGFGVDRRVGSSRVLAEGHPLKSTQVAQLRRRRVLSLFPLQWKYLCTKPFLIKHNFCTTPLQRLRDGRQNVHRCADDRTYPTNLVIAHCCQ